MGTDKSLKELSRNDPCHCGSGKKYKKCHLVIDNPSKKHDPGAIIQEKLANLSPGAVAAANRGLKNSKQTISKLTKTKK